LLLKDDFIINTLCDAEKTNIAESHLPRTCSLIAERLNPQLFAQSTWYLILAPKDLGKSRDDVHVLH
jgi:hypothetical protein